MGRGRFGRGRRGRGGGDLSYFLLFSFSSFLVFVFLFFFMGGGGGVFLVLSIGKDMLLLTNLLAGWRLYCHWDYGRLSFREKGGWGMGKGMA